MFVAWCGDMILVLVAVYGCVASVVRDRLRFENPELLCFASAVWPSRLLVNFLR